MCGDCVFDLNGNPVSGCTCSQGGDPQTAPDKCGCDRSQDYPMNCFFCQHSYTRSGSGSAGGSASGSGGSGSASSGSGSGGGGS